MSKSFPDNLRGYVASRLRTVPMLALVVLLLTAVWFPLLPNSIAVICLQVFLAIVLISMFRLWDDLADLNQDRIQHPDRVLSGTDHARLFQRVCILLGTTVLAVLLASGNTQASLGFSCLVILFVCFYKLPWRANWPLVSYHLLILKYPLFVILISTCDDRPINQLHLIIALLAYFLLCIYEVIHDPVLRSDTRCRLIAGTELVFAAGLFGFSLTVF